jgi:hypothetical protein
MNETPKSKPTAAGIAREVGRFISAIDSLAMTVETAMDSLVPVHKDAHKEYDAYVEKHGEVRDHDGKKRVKMRSHEHCHQFGVIERRLERIHAAQYVVPQSFLVALVSRYDALLGGLVGVLFRFRPETLKSSERVLTFAQLVEFDSIDGAREFVIEKEIETLLRKSHPEQFEWLEKKFEIQLRKDLPSWTDFVEVTERRNLFVHADGVVSFQYLTNCKAEEVVLGAEVKPGAVLVVSQTYFRKAHRVVFEIGVKLAQVLWRKIAPKESEDADYQLLFLADDLLVDGKFDLAKILLDFADTTLAKRHATEWYRLKFLVNRALAYRLSGDKGKCAEILASQDWTAAGDAFKLAEHVLSERFEAAATLMKKIGAASEPHKGDYLNSPMYSEFRKNPLFARTFGGIFGAESHEERLLVSEPSESRPS